MVERVGAIEYDLNLNTNRFSQSASQVTKSVEKMDSQFKNFGGTVSNIAASVSAVLVVQSVIRYADAFGQLQDRLKIATTSAAELELVNRRLMETSNRNYKAIGESVELYLSSESAMREFGYSTNQTLDFIDSLSSSFTINAANAERTKMTIAALDRAMVEGRLSGDAFRMVMGVIPTTLKDTAKYLGVTEREVKAMAVSGKLSMQTFANALIAAQKENAKLASGMETTVVDAVVKLNNNIHKYLGDLNSATGATIGVAKSIEFLADHLTELGYAVAGVSTIVAGRYAGAFTTAAAAKVRELAATYQSLAATRDEAVAREYAANIAVRKATADKQAALASVALAQEQYAAARGSNAEATALKQLITVKQQASAAALQLATAQKAQTAAVEASAAANRAASASAGVLRGAFGLLGGPTGVILIAVAALWAWKNASENAKKANNDLIKSSGQLIENFKDLSNEKAASEILKVESALNGIKKEASEANREVENLKKQLAAVQSGKAAKPTYSKWGATRSDISADKQVSETKRISDELTHALARLDEKQKLVADGTKNLASLREQLTARTKDLNNELKKSEALPEMADSIAAGKANKEIEKQIQLLKETNEKQRAIMQSRMKMQDLQANDKQIKENEQLIAQLYDMKKAEEKRKDAVKASEDAQKDIKDDIQDRIDLIKELIIENQSLQMIEQGNARAAAQFKAVSSMGAGASREQIRQVEELTGREFDIKQAAKDKEIALEIESQARLMRIRDDSLAQVDRMINQGGVISFEQAEQRKLEIAAEYAQKLAELQSKQSVNPIAQLVGTVDPVQQLANENAEKLALLQSFYDQGLLLHQQHEQLKAQVETEYNSARTQAMWDLWAAQSEGYTMLADAFDAFGSQAGSVMTGLITQSMTAKEALQNIASTVLSSLINSFVQLGVQQVKNMIIGQTMAKASTAATMIQAKAVAASWAPAAISASIATLGSAAGIGTAAYTSALASGSLLSLAGGRQHGGGVQGDKMYRIGEGNQPEILQNSDGMFLLPGSRGKVIPNSDINASGGGSGGVAQVNVNIVNNSSGTTIQQNRTQGSDGEVTYDILIEDISSGGRLSQALQQHHQAPRRVSGY